ncbi:hypothetical protein GGTG_12639 [Gaeumannomyces tritici R3-111a-1]|uniref:Uncharacterized protein n=1 Tax=Gaeumannomyces tritici (strain R3-111a-1) TaxID=644352 RepID=J3PGL0_GAET3|nr:hypothetical protein GGTG_12639 [Gaeumannomyces tritici R3-111a-1]EJT69756.1 hypothetical protein GGTG_12639 [Gaeumannomyces tritici R3-111a-1]
MQSDIKAGQRPAKCCRRTREKNANFPRRPTAYKQDKASTASTQRLERTSHTCPEVGQDQCGTHDQTARHFCEQGTAAERQRIARRHQAVFSAVAGGGGASEGWKRRARIGWAFSRNATSSRLRS